MVELIYDDKGPDWPCTKLRCNVTTVWPYEPALHQKTRGENCPGGTVNWTKIMTFYLGCDSCVDWWVSGACFTNDCTTGTVIDSGSTGLKRQCGGCGY